MQPQPTDDELLVKVKAASANPLDWHMLRGTPRLIRLSGDLRRHKPMRAGRDVAGVVVSVGRAVSVFRPGDAVFGACQGAFADYVCGKESDFAEKPEAISFEQAAALPIAGLTALQALRDNGGLRAGHEVLVVGASGGVGTFAVQLARIYGASVTATCRGDAAELVRRLGADQVIDYSKTDVTRGERRFGLIIDLVGRYPFRRLRRVLAPGGRIVAVGGGGPGGRALGRWLARTGAAALASRFSRRKLVLCMSRLDVADLASLAALVEDGRLEPVIDRRFRLEEVPEAIAYVAQGHARGKSVIHVDDPE